jgi:4-hydroxyacetophenone monooxygenase
VRNNARLDRVTDSSPNLARGAGQRTPVVEMGDRPILLAFSKGDHVLPSEEYARVMNQRFELVSASDETIADAVTYADPMVLRGLLYQLTGDESLGSMAVVTASAGYFEFETLTDPSDVALLRSKAADFLKAYRDGGADDIESGPADRLQRSLGLCAGEDIADAEFEMWRETLALDPWARSFTWSLKPSTEQLEGFSVAVIGAGMGGLNAAVQLRQVGIPFTVLEKNSGVGGTWFENRYPGARVDSPSRTYTHTYGAGFPFPNPFCPQSENEKYFNWVADTFDVRKDIQFRTEVTSAKWEEETCTWEIRAEHPHGSQTLRVNAVISCVGFLSRPNVPAIEGMEDFAGELFHSARWPGDLDLEGKRVAVVGSGCTGYQMIPEVAKVASHTYAFQRTPNWVFETPGYLDPFPEQLTWLDRNFPFFTNFVRFRISWMYGPAYLKARFTADPDFQDPHTLSSTNRKVRDLRLEFMRTKFANRPELLEKMLPVAPPMSARPILVDPTWSIYDALLRDNVSLVTDGISRITRDEIEAADGSRYAVDVIVLATGFKSNDFLFPMEIRGRSGQRVEDLWSKDGARAYLGSMLPGFPNFFMIYGPNTNPYGGLQVVDMEEAEARFALGCIGHLIKENKRSVDVTEDAYWRYNDELDQVESTKIWRDVRAHNYFTNEFGRSSANMPFDVRETWRWLRDPRNPQSVGEGPRECIRPYFGEDLVVS